MQRVKLSCHIILLWLLSSASAHCASETPLTPIVAAEQPSRYLPMLADQKVGLVVNQSSRIEQQHLLDFLLAENVDVRGIFAPEHGFRGDFGAGKTINHSVDQQTGLPIYSLYGKTRKPTPDMLADVDVLIFDIQDVGVRFYTYISTLHYLLEAANALHKQVIVLDRPNPNIQYIEGPVLDPAFSSFVGMHPIPVLHGMTVGELALMIKGERWIENAELLNLVVIPVAHYTRATTYNLPLPPSPNLPNATAIRLYPSLCFLEPTTMSIGRGTTVPFQVIGHPQINLGELALSPVSMPNSAPEPKFEGQSFNALDLRDSDISGVNLSLLFALNQQMRQHQLPFITSESFFDKLAGTDQLRQALTSGDTFEQTKMSWQPAIEIFKRQRKPYLLYKE